MKKLVVILLFHICLLPKMLCAQDALQNDTSQYKLYWVRAALGAGTTGLSASVDIYFTPLMPNVKNRYYSLHGFASAELFGVIEAYTIAGTAGWYNNEKYGFTGISAGLGPVWGTKNGKFIAVGWFGDIYEEDPFFTIGIPLQAEFRFDPIRHIGAGVIVFGNLNIKYPYIGIMMSLNIGDLKP